MFPLPPFCIPRCYPLLSPIYLAHRCAIDNGKHERLGHEHPHPLAHRPLFCKHASQRTSSAIRHPSFVNQCRLSLVAKRRIFQNGVSKEGFHFFFCLPLPQSISPSVHLADRLNPEARRTVHSRWSSLVSHFHSHALSEPDRLRPRLLLLLLVCYLSACSCSFHTLVCPARLPP